MNRVLVFRAEITRDLQRQWRTGGNAQAQRRQRGRFFDFTQRLIEHRHTGKDACLGGDEAVEDCARQSIAAHHHCYAAHDQRRDQIAESVGMRNRYRAVVQIAPTNLHRVTDLLAIGDQLLTRKTNRARRCRCARRELE